MTSLVMANSHAEDSGYLLELVFDISSDPKSANALPFG